MTSSTPPSSSLASWRSSNRIRHFLILGCSFRCSPFSQKCTLVRDDLVLFLHFFTQMTCTIFRPSPSDRNRVDTLACVAPLTLVQQSLVAAGNWKRELLLCVYTCVWDGQWRSFAGRNLGGAPDSRRKVGGWLRGDTGVIVAYQCRCLALLLVQLEIKYSPVSRGYLTL